MSSGPVRPLKDLLTRCCAEYNKLCSSKRHRVDSSRKSLIYNMLLDYFDFFFLKTVTEAKSIFCDNIQVGEFQSYQVR